MARQVWSRRSALCAGCSLAAVGCGTSTKPLPTAADLPAGDTAPPTDSAVPSDSATPNDTAPPTDTGPSAPDCAVEAGTEDDGWVAIPLDDYPELREPGGHVWLSDADNLLYVLLMCTEPGCWAAVWSTCTHGACIVEWDHEAGEVWCPCHGSRFDTDGAVLQGPATESLTAFEVGQRDGMLWVKRW